MSDAYGLAGSPIDRSPSPAMHNAAFAALGIDAHYTLRPSGIDDVDTVLAELANGTWKGLNITTPLKAVLAPCVELDDVARRARAVNTLWRDGDRVCGTLTDVAGVTEPLRTAAFRGGVGLIIGAGGAARAAVLALDALGTEVHVAARRGDRAADLLQILQPGKRATAHTLDDAAALAELFGSLNVVVQATPVGTGGDSHALPWEQAGDRLIAFDMVYLPRRTPFLIQAEACGCTTIAGIEMLLAQGAASFTVWTGRQAPVAVMRNALLPAS
ncbi:MAG: shikimate dehydrogenase [Myxococcota bacterium]